VNIQEWVRANAAAMNSFFEGFETDTDKAGANTKRNLDEVMVKSLEVSQLIVSHRENAVNNLQALDEQQRMSFLESLRQQLSAAEDVDDSIAESKSQAVQRMADTMTSLTASGINDLIWMDRKASQVFKSIAKHFTQYFINAALQQLAKVFVVKALKLLALFDKEANDRMAMRIGADYAKYFGMGALRGIDNVASAITNRLSTVTAGFGADVASGSRQVVYNTYYVATAQDETTVRRRIMPHIERAAHNRHSDLAISQASLIGGPDHGFA
jgi:hypothetical protein